LGHRSRPGLLSGLVGLALLEALLQPASPAALAVFLQLVSLAAPLQLVSPAALAVLLQLASLAVLLQLANLGAIRQAAESAVALVLTPDPVCEVALDSVAALQIAPATSGRWE
jgi:hypothetical protein